MYLKLNSGLLSAGNKWYFLAKSTVLLSEVLNSQQHSQVLLSATYSIRNTLFIQ